MKHFLLLMLSWGAASVADSGQPGYPVPTPKENGLFFIQRSKNTNAIVYDANVKPDGSLDPERPVDIYWIRYTTDSTTAPLTYVQDKFAYGVKATPYPGKPGQYVLHFNAYPKKQVYLLRKPDGQHYGAYMMINGRYAELKRVFLQINGGTFWFPNVEYIEIIGRDMATQQLISDHFKPSR